MFTLYLKSLLNTQQKQLLRLVLRWNMKTRSREPGNSREVSNYFSLDNLFSKWGPVRQQCSEGWHSVLGPWEHGGGALCCRNLYILLSLRPLCPNAPFHAAKWPFYLLGFFKLEAGETGVLSSLQHSVVFASVPLCIWLVLSLCELPAPAVFIGCMFDERFQEDQGSHAGQLSPASFLWPLVVETPEKGVLWEHGACRDSLPLGQPSDFCQGCAHHTQVGWMARPAAQPQQTSSVRCRDHKQWF